MLVFMRNILFLGNCLLVLVWVLGVSVIVVIVIFVMSFVDVCNVSVWVIFFFLLCRLFVF